MKTVRFANVVRLFGADVLLLGLFGRLASALAKKLSGRPLWKSSDNRRGFGRSGGSPNARIFYKKPRRGQGKKYILPEKRNILGMWKN